ncbi:MAG: hypothetical protein OQK75_06955 [Gammaproteobacteria bacterium]|nr:hypothetical protein [Gammaproteobacteria bacterium]MCW8987396.1 hypothetical protein [Gammaproteobacteria bacterium]
MTKKAKLFATVLLTLVVSGIGYSKIASAAGCAIISGNLYCF